MCVCALLCMQGSPRLDMTLAAAEAQNAAGFVARSPCANRTGDQLMDCLYGLTPDAIVVRHEFTHLDACL